MLVVYLLYTNGFQSTPVFISWILALILLLATVVYSAVKRRWVVTAINLAVGILCFISLIVFALQRIEGGFPPGELLRSW